MTSPANLAPASRVDFCRLGEALFGKNWETELAQQLAVNRRLIGEIARGIIPCPSDLWREMGMIARRRMTTFQDIHSRSPLTTTPVRRSPVSR